ncbi:MAG: hypothetical protein GWN99_20535 [Gemmatimonadetes bacterium]|uniref:Uncharacterized protein n=1 Tax=Candidatus Kutchimonas denitrificans TaxID=3056748 RepID=A0AAE4ZC04_9BACT|nr:hypothetical protein [Gemmatimonadota bacterium]NIR76642.1 hypothetical protein [Candidatus Kutchimonas denitrificans]NIS03411.1 hypothetical protein [Gemmatimonadota bacterium]NIT69272.1 hypothetical protein [Gemmatimonadota bacterium]NIU54744.1 hypothetical protein [Gemmatimonadota bacterium]
MTAQIPDRLRFERKLFDLIGIAGEGLFDPGEHGMNPVPPHSACCRGFVCTYTVVYGMLQVEYLDINLREGIARAAGGAQAPPLNRTEPTSRNGDCDFDTSYDRVRLGVPFTGKLLIARQFADDRYFDWWFDSLLRYLEVHELEFEDGKLISVIDISGKVAQDRQKALRELEARNGHSLRR